MSGRSHDIYFTPEVLAAQAEAYGRTYAAGLSDGPDPLGPDEAAFIEERDSFYLATVTSDGWPYIQHRGGQEGFLKVMDERTLAFADYRGNRQLISTGNVSGGGRVALFLMDYVHRRRLKIVGHARTVDPQSDASLIHAITSSEDRRRIERFVSIDVEGFDWNCPQYITPRFSDEEVRRATEPLNERIAKLEADLENMRTLLRTQSS